LLVVFFFLPFLTPLQTGYALSLATETFFLVPPSMMEKVLDRRWFKGTGIFPLFIIPISFFWNQIFFDPPTFFNRIKRQSLVPLMEAELWYPKRLAPSSFFPPGVSFRIENLFVPFLNSGMVVYEVPDAQRLMLWPLPPLSASDVFLFRS